MELEDIWPPFALRIRYCDMELSTVRESDYPELAELANGGIRKGNLPAFLVDWDSGTPEEIARAIAQYQWGTRASFQINDWTIELAVRVDGHVVGVQGLNATGFPRTRAVSTGSWLALHEQGKGYGTQMRQATLIAFADHFGATEFHSGYVEGNDASRRVSEKLGYSQNGVKTIVAQDGQAHHERQVILPASKIVRGPYPVEVSGTEAVRAFLGLAPT